MTINEAQAANERWFGAGLGVSAQVSVELKMLGEVMRQQEVLPSGDLAGLP